MDIMLRTIVVVLSTLVTLGSVQAATVMRLGHIMSPQHQVQRTAQKFADEVKARTNGAIEIKIFPSGQLGQEKEMFESLRLGSLELGFIAGNAIEGFEPSEGIFSLPYVFTSYDHVFQTQDGAVGQEVAKRVLAKTGVRYLAHGNIGFRHTLTRSKPIRAIQDFSGLKIRVPPSPAFVSAFKLLGANPTPIPGGDMYTALTTGVVDGVEGTPDILADFKMFEVAKNYSLTSHIYTTIPLVIAERVWKKLTPEQQKAFTEAAREAEVFQRGLVKEGESKIFDQLKAQGVSLIDVDRKPMQERMKAFYDDFAKRIGGSTLIEQTIAAGK